MNLHDVCNIYGYIVAGGMFAGAGNYVTKVAANGEFESKSLQDHFVDGAISSVGWGISVAAGGTMQKEVQELKEISKLINNGVYNIALQRLYKEVHIWVM